MRRIGITDLDKSSFRHLCFAELSRNFEDFGQLAAEIESLSKNFQASDEQVSFHSATNEARQALATLHQELSKPLSMTDHEISLYDHWAMELESTSDQNFSEKTINPNGTISREQLMFSNMLSHLDRLIKASIALEKLKEKHSGYVLFDIQRRITELEETSKKIIRTCVAKLSVCKQEELFMRIVETQNDRELEEVPRILARLTKPMKKAINIREHRKSEQLMKDLGLRFSPFKKTVKVAWKSASLAKLGWVISQLLKLI